jgi:BspA type Leucine rich repeat region (6 copies)/Secretion system C-terminal sorting domain
MKKILLIALAFLATSPLFAQNFTAGGINYSVTSATAPLTVKVAYHSSFTGAANIPATVINAGTTYSVTSIEASAFSGKSGLTSVIVPSSVTSIGSGAFYACTGLTSVNIPASVSDIADFTFQGCSSLTSAKIPSSVTSIGIQAFMDCSGLTSVSISTSVASIAQSAFENCTGLTSVSIPASVTSFGPGAFFGCTGLTSVTVNWAKPLAINANVFQGIILSNALLNVPTGTAALYDATAVWTNFNIQGLVVAPILGQTFTVDGINYIVTKATLPYEVAVHTHTSFTGGANIPASVSNAGNAFAVTGINQEAFRFCTGLTSLTIPSSVTSIGSNAFRDCTGLTSVIIPSSVTIIEDQVFQSCTGLTSVIIPSSVTSVGTFAFGYCSGLTSVTIPSSVTTIGSGAFIDCKGLTSVSIPSSVTSIQFGAFSGCTGLTSVTVNWATPLAIGANVFQSVTLSNVVLNVPVGTAALYDAAAVWTNFNPINATLSNNAFNTLEDINVYPNPSNGIFNFKLNNDLQIEVYNNLGQLLLSEKMISGTNTINIENQAAGIYFLKANDGNNLSTYKIIKN